MALSPDQRRRLLRMNMLMAYASFASSKAVAWTPATLFANAEVGGWYDPSDLTTLFQDAAGTTPVTAVEQPVGLVLDKSKGLVLGSELVTNGTFDSGITGWTKGAGTTNPLSWDSSGKRLIVTNDLAYFASATQTLSGLTIGKSYLVAAAISNNTVDARVHINGLAGASSAIFPPGGGNARFVFAATATSHVVVLQNNQNTLNGVSYWDNISFRELPGNHLSQSTSTARPVLSARVNLLTYTEEFDNAAWTKVGGSISANAVAAPDGTTTADLFTEDGINSDHYIAYTYAGTSGLSYTWSVAVKPNGRTWIALNAFDTVRKAVWFNCTGSGSVGTTDAGVTSASITALGNGWYRLTSARTASAANFFPAIIPTTGDGVLPPYQGNGTSGIYIWGADLRPANAGVGLPAYQRVGAATSGSSTAAGNADYDTTGFPLYLKFDGTDDFLQSSTITPGADKAQVFAGVRKLDTSGNNNMIAEYSADLSGATGGFNLYSINDRFRYGLRQTATAVYDATTYNSPVTVVTSVVHDFAGAAIAQEISPRVNAAVPTLSEAAAGPAGSGNFGSYPLYVGRRGGSTLPFNGQLYSLILRFSAANLDAATITATETWVNGKTRAF